MLRRLRRAQIAVLRVTLTEKLRNSKTDPYALRFNPILRPLYLRLVAAGKAKKLALTVLMRKLILLANTLLKNPNFSLAT